MNKKIITYHNANWNITIMENNNPKYINSLSDLQHYGINAGNHIYISKVRSFIIKIKLWNI